MKKLPAAGFVSYFQWSGLAAELFKCNFWPLEQLKVSSIKFYYIQEKADISTGDTSKMERTLNYRAEEKGMNYMLGWSVLA